MAQEVLIIGHITRPHGVRGEVKVRPDTDFPERFGGLRSVLLLGPGQAGERSVAVEAVRRQGDLVLLKLEGVDDLPTARGLQGMAVAVPWAERVPLPAGTFYVAEVVGLQVRTAAGEILGRIVEILRTPAHDVYRVAGANGDLLIPATRDVVRVIDPGRGEVVVELPAGLRAAGTGADAD